jgi:hypothetical protein
VLDRRLDDSLGQFDRTLGEEQARNARERDSRAATATGSATPEDGAGGEGAGPGGRPGDLRSERGAQQGAAGGQGTGSATAEGGSGEAGGGRDRGTVSGAGSGGADRGIPSGEDDDIVARRLRRAAEQETDPELKEKLWKEYVEYKRNAQGKG